MKTTKEQITANKKFLDKYKIKKDSEVVLYNGTKKQVHAICPYHYWMYSRKLMKDKNIIKKEDVQYIVVDI